MKANIGVDAGRPDGFTAVAVLQPTRADVTQGGASCCAGEETHVCGDAGSTGVQKRGRTHKSREQVIWSNRQCAPASL